MIPVVVAIGLVMAGLAVSTTYLVLAVQKKRKNNEDTDFRCPECGASVDGTVSVCPECMAEFRDGEFECPVCGSAVSADTNICIVCSERFEEEEIFQCPHCGSPIPPDTVVCAKCDEEFWSPVKPADAAEVEVMTESKETGDSTADTASY